MSDEPIDILKILRNQSLLPEIIANQKKQEQEIKDQRALIQELIDYHRKTFMDEIIQLKDALKMLGISEGKWNYLKKNKTISYYQDQRKIYFTRQQIFDYLKAFEVKAIDLSIKNKFSNK